MKDIGFANLNFGTGQNVDAHIIDRFVSMVAMAVFVEAKVDALKNMVPEGWNTRQVFTSKGKQGTAAMWKSGNGRFAMVKVFKLRLGVKHFRAAMLNRYIQMFIINKENKNVLVVVCHAPPLRYKFLWKLFYGNTRKLLVKYAPAGRWVLFADFNKPHQQAMKDLGGAHSYGEGIIGAVTSKKVELVDVEIMSKIKDSGWTDHPGIEANLKLAM